MPAESGPLEGEGGGAGESEEVANSGVPINSPAFWCWASSHSTCRRSSSSPAQESSNTLARRPSSASSTFWKTLSTFCLRSGFIRLTTLSSGEKYILLDLRGDRPRLRTSLVNPLQLRQRSVTSPEIGCGEGVFP